jgi:hypothetical protein
MVAFLFLNCWTGVVELNLLIYSRVDAPHPTHAGPLFSFFVCLLPFRAIFFFLLLIFRFDLISVSAVSYSPRL